MDDVTTKTPRLLDIAYELVARVIGLLPRRAAVAAGAWLGGMTGRIPSRKKSRAELNASRSGRRCVKRFYRDSTRQLGMTVFELLWLMARTGRGALRDVTIEGLEILTAAAAEGRGVLLASGHFATWDLVPLAAARSGLSIAGTAREWRSPRLERRLTALRERNGLRTLIRGRQGTGIAAYRWLRSGHVYLCMMDRISAGRKLTVPFLNGGLNVPLGPAEMACRARSAVVVAFATRNTHGHSVVRFVRIPDDAFRGDPETLARCVGEAVETQARTAPEQWFWIFRRHPLWVPAPATPPLADS